MLTKNLCILLALPFYWFSFIIPKSKFIWVFGAWFGHRYSDNSKYFFEYILRNQPGIKAVWISKNLSLVRSLKKRKLPVHYAYSLPGCWCMLRAGVAVVSHNIRIVVVSSLLFRVAYLVQLCHVVAINKSGYDDNYSYLNVGDCLTNSLN